MYKEMGEGTELTSFGLNLRFACYLIFIFYISVFGANLILLIKNRPWQENSDEEWVNWNWVDVAISGISIFVAFLLLIALMRNKFNNYRLLVTFIVWAIVCLILSALVLALVFAQYKREEIILRCVGIVITAFSIDVVLLFYLHLRKIDRNRTQIIINQTLRALNHDPVGNHHEGTPNIGFSDDVTSSNGNASSMNIRMWYENTKL